MYPKRLILIASIIPAGAPNQVHIEAIPFEITEDRVTLKWTAPKDNGAVITKYTVYRREVNEDGSRPDWEGKQTGLDILQHEVVGLEVEEVNEDGSRSVSEGEATGRGVLQHEVFGLESGKIYEFQVTATNRRGESTKVEEGPNIVQIACGKF